MNVLQIYIIGFEEILIDESSTSSLPEYCITGELFRSFMRQLQNIPEITPFVTKIRLL